MSTKIQAAKIGDLFLGRQRRQCLASSQGKKPRAFWLVQLSRQICKTFPVIGSPILRIVEALKCCGCAQGREGCQVATAPSSVALSWNDFCGKTFIISCKNLCARSLHSKIQ